jgi:hypothetical protein
MDNLFKDVGKQSPKNDITDEHSSIINFRREFGRFIVMASNTDSVTSLPWILNASNERGSCRSTSLLLSHIFNLRMAEALR